jgi:gluconokinase
LPGRDFFIGIDLGTTGVKACVLSKSGHPVVFSQVYSSPLLSGNPGWAEQDPEVVFNDMLACVRGAVQKAGVDAKQIAAISIGGALHSLLAIDGEGLPLSNVITWADTRSAQQAWILRSGASALRLYQRTGMPLHPMSPLPKIIWLREKRRELFDRAAKFLSIKEYVLQKLCGRCIVDYSTASGSGLFNLSGLTWDDEALDEAGIKSTQLSVPVPPVEVIRSIEPKLAAAVGLPAEVQLVVGASDAILSHLGVGAFDPPSCSLTIGTSSGLRAFAPAPVVDSASRGTFCYAFSEGKWLVGCPCSTGGIALQWFNETFPPARGRDEQPSPRNSLADEIESALQIPIGAEGLLFLPFVTGERAPGRNPEARGAFIGARLHHRREHFVRAIIEGIILSVHSLYVPLERLGVKPQESRVSGGFAATPEIRQVMADVFGHDVVIPNVSEACSYGAALLAMHAIGVLPSLSEIPKQVQVGDRRRPDKVRQRAFTGLAQLFESVYRQLEPSFTDLVNLQKLQFTPKNEEMS